MLLRHLPQRLEVLDIRLDEPEPRARDGFEHHACEFVDVLLYDPHGVGDVVPRDQDEVVEDRQTLGVGGRLGVFRRAPELGYADEAVVGAPVIAALHLAYLGLPRVSPGDPDRVGHRLRARVHEPGLLEARDVFPDDLCPLQHPIARPTIVQAPSLHLLERLKDDRMASPEQNGPRTAVGVDVLVSVDVPQPRAAPLGEVQGKGGLEMALSRDAAGEIPLSLDPHLVGSLVSLQVLVLGSLHGRCDFSLVWF